MKKLYCTAVGLTLLGFLNLDPVYGATHIKKSHKPTEKKEIFHDMYLKLGAGYGMTNGVTYSNKYIYKTNPADRGVDPWICNQKGPWSVKYNEAITGVKDKTTENDSLDVQRLKGLVYDIGIGKNFTKYIRGDITLSYSRYDNKPKTQKMKPLYFKGSSVRGIVSLYHDIYQGSYFKPFIGLGLGVERTKNTLHLSPKGEIQASQVGGNWGLDDDGRSKEGMKAILEHYKPGDPEYMKGSVWYKLEKGDDVEGFEAFYKYDQNGEISPKPSSSDPRFKKLGGKSKNNFAYEGTIGVTYQVSDYWAIDFAYKIANVPTSEKINLLKQNVPRKLWKDVTEDLTACQSIATSHFVPVGLTDGGWEAWENLKYKKNYRHSVMLSMRYHF